MKTLYKTQGTCSTAIELEVENGILEKVRFYGGCNGNLQAISKLVQGMSISEITSKLEGLTCGSRPTSCSDQLCKALKNIKTI